MEKGFYGDLTEDSMLVESLGELCGDPNWRGENGDFKDGYIAQLETMMEAKMPGCRIKAVAIASRVNWLRTKYFAIAQMINVFGNRWWDEDQMMIIGDKSLYDYWVTMDKNARGLYRKPFLFYYSLEQIYGKFPPPSIKLGDAADADVSKKCYERDVEDDALVESLLELSQHPNWLANNVFKNGYIAQLKIMIESKLSCCEIKATHVECRVNFLRKRYFAVTRMRSKGEFCWDEKQMMLSGLTYNKSNEISKRERYLFNKPFRHYYALERVYAKRLC